MGGQKIFLTGASSGIGLATAKALLARGHHVWGTARDAGRVPSLNDLHAVTLDLSDPGSIRDGFEEGLRQAGSFDVVINNAGSGHLPIRMWQEHAALHPWPARSGGRGIHRDQGGTGLAFTR